MHYPEKDEQLMAELDALLTVLRRGVAFVRLSKNATTAMCSGNTLHPTNPSTVAAVDKDTSASPTGKYGKSTQLLLTQRARAAMSRFIHTEPLLQRQVAAGVSVTALVVDCLPNLSTPFISLLQHKPTRRSRKTTISTSSSTSSTTGTASPTKRWTGESPLVLFPSYALSRFLIPVLFTADEEDICANINEPSLMEAHVTNRGNKIARAQFEDSFNSVHAGHINNDRGNKHSESSRDELCSMDEGSEEDLCYSFEMGCHLRRMGTTAPYYSTTSAGRSGNSAGSTVHTMPTQFLAKPTTTNSFPATPSPLSPSSSIASRMSSGEASLPTATWSAGQSCDRMHSSRHTIPTSGACPLSPQSKDGGKSKRPPQPSPPVPNHFSGPKLAVLMSPLSVAPVQSSRARALKAMNHALWAATKDRADLDMIIVVSGGSLASAFAAHTTAASPSASGFGNNAPFPPSSMSVDAVEEMNDAQHKFGRNKTATASDLLLILDEDCYMSTSNSHPMGQGASYVGHHYQQQNAANRRSALPRLLESAAQDFSSLDDEFRASNTIDATGTPGSSNNYIFTLQKGVPVDLDNDALPNTFYWTAGSDVQRATIIGNNCKLGHLNTTLSDPIAHSSLTEVDPGQMKTLANWAWNSMDGSSMSAHSLEKSSSANESWSMGKVPRPIAGSGVSIEELDVEEDERSNGADKFTSNGDQDRVGFSGNEEVATDGDMCTDNFPQKIPRKTFCQVGKISQQSQHYPQKRSRNVSPFCIPLTATKNSDDSHHRTSSSCAFERNIGITATSEGLVRGRKIARFHERSRGVFETFASPKSGEKPAFLSQDGLNIRNCVKDAGAESIQRGKRNWHFMREKNDDDEDEDVGEEDEDTDEQNEEYDGIHLGKYTYRRKSIEGDTTQSQHEVKRIRRLQSVQSLDSESASSMQLGAALKRCRIHGTSISETFDDNIVSTESRSPLRKVASPSSSSSSSSPPPSFLSSAAEVVVSSDSNAIGSSGTESSLPATTCIIHQHSTTRKKRSAEESDSIFKNFNADGGGSGGSGSRSRKDSSGGGSLTGPALRRRMFAVFPCMSRQHLPHQRRHGSLGTKVSTPLWNAHPITVPLSSKVSSKEVANSGTEEKSGGKVGKDSALNENFMTKAALTASSSPKRKLFSGIWDTSLSLDSDVKTTTTQSMEAAMATNTAEAV